MSKVLYAVWCDLRPSIEEEWEDWMRNTHVPQVVRAPSFLGARMYSAKEGGAARRVTIYEAKDVGALQRYIEGPAKSLREDCQKRFGDRTKLSRTVLEETYSF
ncbi:MAG: DUF4286 family protein [Nitrososphaerales archaeon]|nr:DUF4286 family protein [Nitrososphaerales archaeon]